MTENTKKNEPPPPPPNRTKTAGAEVPRNESQTDSGGKKK